MQIRSRTPFINVHNCRGLGGGEENVVQYSSSSSIILGPCHHGMARPQVVDGGTASDKEGSCE
jgi:hypothetical protein